MDHTHTLFRILSFFPPNTFISLTLNSKMWFIASSGLTFNKQYFYLSVTHLWKIARDARRGQSDCCFGALSLAGFLTRSRPHSLLKPSCSQVLLLTPRSSSPHLWVLSSSLGILFPLCKFSLMVAAIPVPTAHLRHLERVPAWPQSSVQGLFCQQVSTPNSQICAPHIHGTIVHLVAKTECQRHPRHLPP